MSLGSNVDSNISTAHSQRKDRRHHLPLFRLWVQNLVHKSKTQVQNLAQFCFPRKDTEKLGSAEAIAIIRAGAIALCREVERAGPGQPGDRTFRDFIFMSSARA